MLWSTGVRGGCSAVVGVVGAGYRQRNGCQNVINVNLINLNVDVACVSPTSDVRLCTGVDDPRNRSSVFIRVSGEDAVELVARPSIEYTEAV